MSNNFKIDHNNIENIINDDIFINNFTKIIDSFYNFLYDYIIEKVYIDDDDLNVKNCYEFTRFVIRFMDLCLKDKYYNKNSKNSLTKSIFVGYITKFKTMRMNVDNMERYEWSMNESDELKLDKIISICENCKKQLNEVNFDFINEFFGDGSIDNINIARIQYLN